MSDQNTSSAATYEQLGSFYLGRRYDQGKQEPTSEDILYDAKDLTTHAVCIGMTGSGKTGLCTCLLEEAAIDGVPAIIIDPKGDMGNLLLGFPKLRPQDFEPWIDPAAAARKGLEPAEFAKTRSELWKKGLADWGQDGNRIKRLKEATEIRLYTPGSSAGIGISVLRSFAAPAAEILADGDAFRERVMGTVSGILTLLGIVANPVKSRDHILLSTILDHYWRQERDLDIPGLISSIQRPPVDKIGVLPLDSFYPADERMELVLTINNLLASPSFEAWMQGDPLDINNLLFSPAGKPRLSILYIAHLSDAERMFFVTLLLNEVVSWMRNQPGTGSLRALVYMDEVFGYFPPVANPPSKQPMLTLLKQARAYGLGVVLATQNPADLDYKGLSNTGTWFLGRLQTERDKLRVMDGLEGLTGGDNSFSRKELDNLLSSLDSRVFLMNNVHEAEPVLFHTRWALSYLRGPLTRLEIQRLSKKLKSDPDTEPLKPQDINIQPSRPRAKSGPLGTRSLVATEIDELFADPGDLSLDSDVTTFNGNLLGRIRLHFIRKAFGLDEWRDYALLGPLTPKTAANPWVQSRLVDISAMELLPGPPEGAVFSSLPGQAAKPAGFKTWEKQFKDWVYGNVHIKLFECKQLKLRSAPGESQAQFGARVNQQLREIRDLEIEKLRDRYAKKTQVIERKVHSAEQAVAREQSQLSQRNVDTAISIGTTVLGALFGRKAISSTRVREAGSVARKAGRSSRERQDVKRAKQTLTRAKDDLYNLDLELQDELFELRGKYSAGNFTVVSYQQAPRKSDLTVESLVILWLAEAAR